MTEQKPTILCINPYDGKAMGDFQDVGGKQIPLGLSYIASIIEREGYTVRICDELVGQDGCAFIDAHKPDVLFMSVFPSCSDRAKKVIDHAKQSNPQTMIVIGGAVAQKGTAEKYFDDLEADAMVMGEGEIAAPLLLGKPRSSWHDIKGIVFKEHGKMIHTGEPELIMNLDELPFPALHLLDISRYRGPTEQGFFESYNEPTMSIMTARGCQFACKFCSSGNKLGRKVRFRSPKNVVDEIENAVLKHGIRHFQINDDTFTANIPRVIEICKLIVDRKLKITWIVQTRAEICTLEMFQWMKKAGCVMVAFGVESGSDKVLTFANKQLDLAFVRRGAKWAREAGLRVKTYFQVGLPGEDEEDFKQSVKLAKELDPDYLWLSKFLPLPGTPFYDMLIAEHKITHDQVKDMSFFNQSHDSSVNERHKRFLRSFYIRPGYFIRFIKRFSFKEFMYLARMGGVFLKTQMH